MTLAISEICKILGIPFSGEDREVRTLLTDSRTPVESGGTLFFAIRTGANNGHRYIRSLYGRGVRDFVVESIPQGMEDLPGVRFLTVDDTVAALQRIASRRDNAGGRVIAITGSYGKTTVKELLYDMVSADRPTVRSPRSYNSRIGVPLSLWEIEDDTQLSLIEAGISRTGEMETLRRIIRPEIVILTAIGSEHDEGFADRREKCREKLRLAEGASKLIIPAGDPLVAEEARRMVHDGKPEIITWSDGSCAADLTLPPFETNDDGTLKPVSFSFRGGAPVEIAPDSSMSHYHDSLAAVLATLCVLGYGAEIIRPRISHLRPVQTRLDVTEGINDCSLIRDTASTDLPSLLPALDFMSRRDTDGRSMTLVIHDFDTSTTASGPAVTLRRLRDVAARAGVTRMIGVGPVMHAHSDLLGDNAVTFPTVDALMEAVSPSDFEHEIILISGQRNSGLDLLAEQLEARKHETVLEVNLDAVVRNFNTFRSKLPAGTGLIAMVKATAYGAGSLEIARTMQDHGAAYLAVAVLDEGIELRDHGITMPIMVMNPRVANYRAMFAYNLEPEIYTFSMLRDVIREAAKNGVKDYPVHLKLDTGMHRMGFSGNDLDEVMRLILSQENVRISSVFSHLATADCPDMDDYTLHQLDLFEQYTQHLLKLAPYRFKRHILNSAAIMRFPQYHYDMARLGIGLYGINTLPPDMEPPLETVSSLRTVIIALRELQPGDSVGYGRKGRITRPSVIATLPIGYADGMNRRFGNGAIRMLVNGQEAPTIGNICMDACMIDVTGIDCREGDSVEIFGPRLTVQRLADTLQTIPYEVLTSVSPRVKRVYFRE